MRAILAAFALVAPAAPQDEAPLPPAWDAVRRQFEAFAAEKDLALRLQALRLLHDRRERGAAGLALATLRANPVDAAKGDRFDEAVRIREAAIEALGTLDGEAIEELLGPGGAGSPGWEVASAAIEAVGAAGGRIAGKRGRSDPGYRRIREGVESSLQAREPTVRAAAAAALATLRDPDDLPRLSAVLEDPCWQARLEAVRGLAALGETRTADALDPLIRALGSEGGRLRDDIRAALRRLTGVDLGHDPDLWRSWWEANRARPASERTRPDRGKSRAATRFYGIEVASKRVTFVIDVTGSMHKYHEIEKAQEWLRREADLKRPPYVGETLMDLEKYQLTNVIRELPEDASFTVVLFSSAEVRACFPRLVPATAANREKATKFVRAMGWAGDTNLYEGLVRPFQLTGSQRRDFEEGPDTVLLFTDGDINSGRIREAAEMRDAVRALHRLRRVRVDTIGIGTYDRRVLRSLAEVTGGIFQDVPVPIDRVREAGHSHTPGG